MAPYRKRTPKGPAVHNGGGNPNRGAGLVFKNSYIVQLNVEGQRSSRQVFFNKGQEVRIRVTTTQWGDAWPPDVDLYVYDPMGNCNWIDLDPDKDCFVSFIAPQAGNYRVELHLCNGNSATCRV